MEWLKKRSQQLWADAAAKAVRSMPTISHTEVDNYRRCQKRWEYRYQRGLKRVRKGIRLLRGEILHEMLNAYIKSKMIKGYVGDDPWDVLAKYEDQYKDYFAEEREHYGDIPGDCGRIFEGYLRKYRKDPLKYEASEEQVFFDISNDLRFIGFIDKIATDAEGRRWIVDHKFVQNIPTAEDRFADLQLLLYVWAWALSHKDIEVDGICWDYARAKAPTKPELLKDGKSLSKRKNIDCDPHTYLQTIREHKLDPTNYVDMLEHLEGKEDTFYERVFLPKPPKAMIDEVTQDFLATAKEIQQKRKGQRCVRTMNSFNCNTCEFRPVCEAEVRGLDSEFIIKSDYVEREIGDD